MIRLKADLRALRELRRKVGRDAVLMRRITKSVAEELLGLVQDGFRSETDPAGRRWERKKRPDGRQVLVGKTARLRRGWHVEKMGRTSVTIAPAVDYADFHQQGTKRMVARKMVPEGVLPRAWGDRINESVQEILRQTFG
jgi:phage gpG-like protein